MCDHVFVNMFEGTTIRGEHLHVYKCVKDGCGMVDYSAEAWEVPDGKADKQSA